MSLVLRTWFPPIVYKFIIVKTAFAPPLIPLQHQNSLFGGQMNIYLPPLPKLQRQCISHIDPQKGGQHRSARLPQNFFCPPAGGQTLFSTQIKVFTGMKATGGQVPPSAAKPVKAGSMPPATIPQDAAAPHKSHHPSRFIIGGMWEGEVGPPNTQTKPTCQTPPPHQNLVARALWWHVLQEYHPRGSTKCYTGVPGASGIPSGHP